jgi:hypothetical protein
VVEAEHHTKKNSKKISSIEKKIFHKMKSVLFAMMGLAALANAAEITHKVYFDIQIGNEDAGTFFRSHDEDDA